jgi:hypothetical protein
VLEKVYQKWRGKTIATEILIKEENIIVKPYAAHHARDSVE